MMGDEVELATEGDFSPEADAARGWAMERLLIAVGVAELAAIAALVAWAVR
jgi:hypothetical protein